MSKSVRATDVAPLASEMPPLWRTVAALRSSAALPPVIGKLAVVPSSVAGPITPGAMPSETIACSAAGSIASAVAPCASSSVWDGSAWTRTVPSGMPLRNASTPNVAFSARAAARLSRAVRPDTFVPKPERETRGVPVRSSTVTRAPPTRAESVILRPTRTV